MGLSRGARKMSPSPIPAPAPSVQISWGELLDKVTILEIRGQRLNSQAAIEKIHRELAVRGRSYSLRTTASYCSQGTAEIGKRDSLGYRRQNTGQGGSEIVRSTIH